MANSSPVISGVNAGYGPVRVLEDVSISVAHAETVALLGTNGNGKSTLMKCIMGMLRPTSGSIVAEIDGERARAGRAYHRGDRRSRHRAGARGAAALSQADGRGKPAARRVPPEGAQRDRRATSNCPTRPSRVLQERRRQLAGSMSAAASSRCWRWRAR